MKHNEGIYKECVGHEQDSGVGTAGGVQPSRSIGVAVLSESVAHAGSGNGTRR